MSGIIVNFFLNDKKLSSNLAQISEHNNSSNRKIHFYDQMINMTVNLDINAGKKLTTPHPNSSIYIIHH